MSRPEESIVISVRVNNWLEPYVNVYIPHTWRHLSDSSPYTTQIYIVVRRQILQIY